MKTKKIVSTGNLIGKRIRLLRELRGWTQHELAQKLRAADNPVTRDVIARWELRQTPVTDVRIKALAVVLRTSINDLFPPRKRRRPKKY
jgi:transcriptional regulator with XRE-family HTH domain